MKSGYQLKEQLLINRQHSSESEVTLSPLCLTLFCDLNLTSAKFSLFDVLDAEVTAALGVDLSFVPR